MGPKMIGNSWDLSQVVSGRAVEWIRPLEAIVEAACPVGEQHKIKVPGPPVWELSIKPTTKH